MLAGQTVRRAWWSLTIGVLVLVGCTAQGTPPPASSIESAAASAASVASPGDTPLSFTSDQHSYAIRLPSGWTLRHPASTPWEAGAGLHATSAAADSFRSPNRDSDFFAGARVLDAGATLESWTATVIETIEAQGETFDCDAVQQVGDISMGAEPALVLEHHCPDWSVLWAPAVHDGRGYLFGWFLPDADADESITTSFGELLEGVTFSPGP